MGVRIIKIFRVKLFSKYHSSVKVHINNNLNLLFINNLKIQNHKNFKTLSKFNTDLMIPDLLLNFKVSHHINSNLFNHLKLWRIQCQNLLYLLQKELKFHFMLILPIKMIFQILSFNLLINKKANNFYLIIIIYYVK